MKKWIKRSIYVINVILGLSIIFFVTVANSITKGIDVEAINDVINYVSVLEPSGLASDVDIMFFFIQISNYSHFILTISIIWIILFLYMLKMSK